MDTDARFCWTELSTTDRDRASRFYTRLLGWESLARPLRTRLGQSLDYTLFCVRGQNVAGMYPLANGQRKQGVRPQWLSYVFVEDVAATIARARELEATLLAGPLDVYDLGRLAILRDPEGALLGVWQPKRLDRGFQTRNQSGFASWFEHVAVDVPRAAQFYTALFGWSQRSAAGDETNRVMLELAGSPVAGISSRGERKLAPQWLTFFQVADCDASCQKAVNMQGSVVASPAGTPDANRCAVVSDPQGAVFGLLTP